MFQAKQQRASLQAQTKLARFELLMLPHMSAAYNFARWLTRSDHDAEEVVEEAYLRAFHVFDGFRGADGRSWLLGFVRNACNTWLRQNRGAPGELGEEATANAGADSNSETQLVQNVDQAPLRKVLEDLPVEFRETIVLRELEGLPYKEIGAVLEVPLGTVMSRIAQARARLQKILTDHIAKGGAA